MKLLAMVTAFGAMLCAGSAGAEPSVKQYQDSLGEDRTLLTLYIIAAEDAFSWTNASLHNRGDAQLYCVPDRLALTNDQVIDIVDRYAVSRADVVDQDQMYLAMFVLFAMEDAFPCTDQGRTRAAE